MYTIYRPIMVAMTIQESKKFIAKRMNEQRALDRKIAMMEKHRTAMVNANDANIIDINTQISREELSSPIQYGDDPHDGYLPPLASWEGRKRHKGE